MDKENKKVLIIRLGALGDVVMTTIIASAIKNIHPDYEIHYLTQSEIAPVLENHPHIDKIIYWDRKNRKSLKQLFHTGIRLYKEHYDITINLTYSIRNIILALMTCAKKITHRKYTKFSWVEDYFFTAKSVLKDLILPPNLTLGVDNEIKEKIKLDISKYKKPYIIITPGGNTNNHRQGRAWSIKNWQELANKLIEKYNGTIFVCGAKSERNLHNQISGNDIVITSGNYSIKESSALFSQADIMISGDTGPVHIASALGIPVISLLGSTSPDKIKPYGEKGYYISAGECLYCWKKKCKYLKNDEVYTPCMEKINTEMILDKIDNENIL